MWKNLHLINTNLEVEALALTIGLSIHSQASRSFLSTRACCTIFFLALMIGTYI